MTVLQGIIVKLISAYQARHAGLDVYRVECNFEPSCSEYTKQAVAHYGALRGTVLGIKRIKRCCERDQVGTRLDPLVTDCDHV